MQYRKLNLALGIRGPKMIDIHERIQNEHRMKAMDRMEKYNLDKIQRELKVKASKQFLNELNTIGPNKGQIAQRLQEKVDIIQEFRTPELDKKKITLQMMRKLQRANEMAFNEMNTPP